MKIDYMMSKEYCADWTAIDAIREIVQNAIDSGKEYRCDLQPEDNCIQVVTYSTNLAKEVFGLGVSKKQDGAIGKYGEGFKIGMMVLEREGLEPALITDTLEVTASFELNEAIGIETFNLNIEESESEVAPYINFMCRTDGIDLDELKRKVTPFAEKPIGITSTVKRLDNQSGIYVNGLFVCEDDELTFGYNFNPANITLNRDRNMVDGVEWQLATYYNDTPPQHASALFELIEAGAKDVRLLGYMLTNVDLKKNLAMAFAKKYGVGKAIAHQAGSYIGGSHVSYNESTYRTMRAAGISEAIPMTDPESPAGIIENFLALNKKRMRRDLRVQFDKLHTKSKGWSKAGIY